MADFKPTPEFLEFQRDAEGGTQERMESLGLVDAKTGNWLPYKDSVGKWTIGVGHLINDGSELPDWLKGGLSREESLRLHEKDVKEKARIAKSQVGEDKWDSLSQRDKELLTEIAFNGGGPKAYPNLTKAVIAGDKKAMALEHHRSAGPKGKKKPLTRRNRLTSKFFGLETLTREEAEKAKRDGVDPRPRRSSVNRVSERAGNRTYR